MASLQYMVPSSTVRQSVGCNSPFLHSGMRPALVGLELRNKKKRSLSLMVVAAVGDVTSDGNNYLIAGAIGVALLGTVFPIFFSRNDICQECDGAGFVRKGGATLSANAAQKDLPHIVCANCNGLGKLGQIDNRSRIYTPEEWSESGDRYAGGVAGLAIWAVTLGGILLGGALLVYNTSALSQ